MKTKKNYDNIFRVQNNHIFYLQIQIKEYIEPGK